MARQQFPAPSRTRVAEFFGWARYFGAQTGALPVREPHQMPMPVAVHRLLASLCAQLGWPMTRGDLTRINVRLSSFRTIFSQHPSITLALVCEWQGFSAVNINLFEEAEMITPRFRLAYLVVLMGLAI